MDIHISIVSCYNSSVFPDKQCTCKINLNPNAFLQVVFKIAATLDRWRGFLLFVLLFYEFSRYKPNIFHNNLMTL